jgi:hypothetical protein
MAYTTWSVVFGEQPSAAKWNLLGSNDASFNDGTGINTDAIHSSQLFKGLLLNRQGNTTGDNSWYTAGTNNTAIDGKDVFIQTGNKAVASDPTTVTFPTAYNQVPLVFASTSTAASANVYTIVISVNTTQFTLRQIIPGTGASATEAATWIAIGQ